MIIRLVGVFIFLVILIFSVVQSIDIAKVEVLMAQFPKLELLGLMGLTIIISFLKGYRFYLLLKDIKIPVTFWQAIKVYVAGQAISPLPGGESARSFLLTKEVNQNFAKVSGPVVSQAFLELVTAVLITLLGSFIFNVLRLPAVGLLILIIGLGVFLTNRTFFSYALKIFNKLAFLKSLISQLKIVQQGIRFDKTFLLGLGVSLIANLIGGFIFMTISHYFEISLGLLKSLFIYSSGIVITGLAAVIPGGLGVTEGGMTGLLVFNQVDLVTALAIVLLFRVVTFVFPTLLGLMILLIFYGKILLTKKNDKK